MIRSVTSALLALGLLLALAPSAAGEGENKPVAIIVEPVKDFEVAPQGKVLDATFEIRNAGEAPLEITDVRPACGCTVVEYDKVVAPGETAKIRAQVETDSFSGAIAKTIAVFTNDPENPKLQLVVKAEIKPYIGVAPGYARFSYVQGEPIGKISQTLWAEDQRDVKVLEVKAPYDHVKVEHHQATEEERSPKSSGEQWVIDITIDEYSPVGALRDYVVVTTDHPEQKTVQIPISGFVRPRQWVTPEKVELGQLETSVLPATRTFAFTNFITDEIEIEKVETGFEAMTAQVEAAPRQPGHRFQVTLTLGPEMPKGPIDTVIKIHTTDPKNPVVEVPISGAIL